MEERQARAWLTDQLYVPRETLDGLRAFVAAVRSESENQNLVSRATMDQIWVRHILDSAQLLLLNQQPHASWIDLGSGAGFPGLIVALLHQGPVTLVEERRKRAEFLTRGAAILGLTEKVQIVQRDVERMEPQPFDVISARAFAPLGRLLELGERFSTAKTRWILPKGRNAQSELEAVQASWQGEFRLEPSLTDADAQIIVATGVRRKSES
jgi:16S rRNA (guanine527-N7)-methyltransferase